VRRAKTESVDEMLRYTDRWVALEVARLSRKGKDTTGIADIGECLAALSEGETEVAAVLAKIGRLFADGDEKSRVTLSSTHKAKGMELDRVWMLAWTYCRNPKNPQEELNLKYVAITRARKALILVQQKKTA
jgi:superfamily I DNA/RNA helicase